MATSKRILYTRHDGGVSICCPSPEIFGIMQNGGYWNDRPRGFVDEQIRRQIADGIAPDHARRFAHAVAFGGVTEAEAWGVIRDRDCARHGTMHELIEFDELPGRWFRNAWYRSSNGGPVGVNLRKARRIQLSRIKWAAEKHNASRLALGRMALAIPWLTIGAAIRHSRDERELRRIWPEGLARPKELGPPQ